MQIKQIAYIRSDFVEKFGIPRQSNLADTRAEIHFLPEYQNADALREIEAYDYLWLICPGYLEPDGTSTAAWW